MGTATHLAKALFPSGVCDRLVWLLVGWNSMLTGFKGRQGDNAPIKLTEIKK